MEPIPSAATFVASATRSARLSEEGMLVAATTRDPDALAEMVRRLSTALEAHAQCAAAVVEEMAAAGLLHGRETP